MFDPPRTTALGCSHLRCGLCGADVRNAAGLALAPGADVSKAHASPDLTHAPSMQRGHAAFRLYLCRCTSWLMTSTLPLALRDGDPDPDIDPPRTWACAGHPTLSVPGTIDGASVRARSDVKALAVRAFHGNLPPAAPSVDVEHGACAIRLHARLPADDAQVVVDAAIDTLTERVAAARGRALDFFQSVPDDVGLVKVASMIATEVASLAMTPDPVGRVEGETLADSAWRALGTGMIKSERIRDAVREAATAPGTGRGGVYSMLAQHDPAWMADNADRIAQATPERATELFDAFHQLPVELEPFAVSNRARVGLAAALGGSPPTREGIQSALAALGAKLATASRTRRIYPELQDLPPLDPKTALLLSFKGEANGPRVLTLYVLDIGGYASEPVVEGSHQHVLARLKAPDLAELLLAAAARIAAAR